MKIILILTVVYISIDCSSARYVHSYGDGHGGGHGFYGYPVGRKWGYSTEIKHPPPKHHSGYGGHGQGGNNYGGIGYGLPGFEHGGYFPNFGYGYGPGYGGHGGHGSGFSHTYRDQYIPHSGYGYGRPLRPQSGYGAGPAVVYGPTGYDSYGHHKNHNYGHNYGVPSRVHNTGHIKPAYDGLNGFDNFFGKYGLI